MTDRIIIDDFRFFGFHGLLPEETKLGQRFRVDLSCELDLSGAGASDDIAGTVNYGEILALVERIGTGRTFKLIEALAETIARELFAAFAPIDCVRIRITKPEAPVQFATGTIAIEIERSRDIA